MIQFNLLPDVKLDYLKTRRTKRLVVVVATVAAGITLAALVIMFLTVQVAQKKHINDLSKDISSQEKTLKDTPDLDKILTIQNQLAHLPDLHDDKLVTSRVFDYIPVVTPQGAHISSISVDFDTSTITMSGTGDTPVVVNKFADTLKFATYKTKTTEGGKPFSNVVTSLTASSDGKASYSFSFNFDPILFTGGEEPEIIIPKITSTRSETEKPSAIFKADPEKK